MVCSRRRYDYRALAGTYVWAGNGTKYTLKLASDHTFAEEIDESGNRSIVQGQWRRYGQSHVSFSNQFIKVPGQELNAAGEAHGQFEKTLGILPSLVLAPVPNGSADKDDHWSEKRGFRQLRPTGITLTT